MIKTIFVPERIDSYYIFSQRIVGIDIGRTAVYATIVRAHGSKRTVEQCIEEPISPNSQVSQEERIIEALKSLKSRLGSYDSLHVAFPSASVIFKELSIPFIGLKKIKMVVPFEVESLLPFSLEHAVIDSIVTHQDTTQNRTELLVAAVKQEHIAQFLSLFDQAQIPVNKLSIDMFELYGLYLSIPRYAQLKHIVALIDIGLTSIRLAIIINGQLKYIRVLSTGLISAAKKIAGLLNSETTQTLEHLMRFGLEHNDKPDYAKASEEVLQDLLNELRFTIVSYTSKLKDSEPLNEIVITGTGADIPGLQKLVATTMETKSEVLQAKKIMHNGQINSKITLLPNSFLVSLATALSLPSTQEFNLLQEQAAREENTLITNQLVAALGLALVLITSFSVYSYLRVRNVKNTYQEASKEALTEIKRAFKLKESQATSLDIANKRANMQLQNEESTWQRLSAHNRYSLLTILAALSKCINFNELKLDVQTIKIKNNKVQLFGSVPDYKNLDILQRQLECPLFHKIGKLNDITFKSEPIELTVKDEEGS